MPYEKTYNEILVDAIKEFFPTHIAVKYVQIVEREREMALSDALAHMREVYSLKQLLVRAADALCTATHSVEEMELITELRKAAE